MFPSIAIMFGFAIFVHTWYKFQPGNDWVSGIALLLLNIVHVLFFNSISGVFFDKETSMVIPLFLVALFLSLTIAPLFKIYSVKAISSWVLWGAFNFSVVCIMIIVNPYQWPFVLGCLFFSCAIFPLCIYESHFYTCHGLYGDKVFLKDNFYQLALSYSSGWLVLPIWIALIIYKLYQQKHKGKRVKSSYLQKWIRINFNIFDIPSVWSSFYKAPCSSL